MFMQTAVRLWDPSFLIPPTFGRVVPCHWDCCSSSEHSPGLQFSAVWLLWVVAVFPVPRWWQQPPVTGNSLLLDQAGAGKQLLPQDTAEGCQAELICQCLSLCFYKVWCSNRVFLSCCRSGVPMQEANDAQALCQSCSCAFHPSIQFLASKELVKICAWAFY